MLASQSSAL